MLAEATRRAEADSADEYLAGVLAALRWVGELTYTTPFTNTTKGAMPETMPVEALAAERGTRVCHGPASAEPARWACIARCAGLGLR
jgi:hypothetical protein